MVVLPFVVWTDLRFRIAVEEADGTPVEVDVKTFHFHRPPRSYFQSFDYGYGNRLKKGVIYFGFCQWVKHREDLDDFRDAGPPGERSHRGSLRSRMGVGKVAYEDDRPCRSPMRISKWSGRR